MASSVTPGGAKRILRLLKQGKDGGNCDRPTAVTVDTWSSLCKTYLKKSSRPQRWLTQISPDGVACLLKNEALSCGVLRLDEMNGSEVSLKN